VKNGFVCGIVLEVMSGINCTFLMSVMMVLCLSPSHYEFVLLCIIIKDIGNIMTRQPDIYESWNTPVREGVGGSYVASVGRAHGTRCTQQLAGTNHTG